MEFYPLNRSPEQVAKETTQFRLKLEALAISGAIGATALTLFSGINMFDQEISRFESDSKTCIVNNGKFTIITGNTRNNPGYTAKLMNETAADIGVFQEVSKDNGQKIAGSVPNATAMFAPSDYPVAWEDGGQGNMTVSIGLNHTEKLYQIFQRVDLIPFMKSVVVGDKKSAAKSYTERRSFLFSNFDSKISGVKTSLNLVNVHIGGNKDDEYQLEDITDLAENEMNDNSQIQIITGDMNRTPEEVRTAFEKLKKPWVVLDIGPTSRDSNDQIDQVIYDPVVIIKDVYYVLKPSSRIVDIPGSDHKAISTTLEILPVDQASALEKYPKNTIISTLKSLLTSSPKAKV